jgi:membrane-bound lytic murein transglycosylase B
MTLNTLIHNRLLKLFVFLFLFSACSNNLKNDGRASLKRTFSWDDVEAKNWGYLASLFIENGFSKDETLQLFTDPRIKTRDNVFFRLKPRESANTYSKIYTQKNRQLAAAFYENYSYSFSKAAEQYNVPSALLLAILTVETGCGKNVGNKRVFEPLARLATVQDAKNIEATYKKLKKEDPTITKEGVIERAKWLEETFLPHVLAVSKVAQYLGVHPLELRGSSAGAIGFPQFLPGNYFKYGVDGDEDGKIDLFSAIDSIYSVANFLKSKGWKGSQLHSKANKLAILEYNRSEPYYHTVIKFAEYFNNNLIKSKKS